MVGTPWKYPIAEAVRAAYQSGEDDESLEPRVLVDARGKPIDRFQDGDYVIFCVKAAETVDFHLGRVLEASRKAGVITLITADHGTAKKWFYPDGSIDTGHTNSPVPFILDPAGKEER